MIIFMIIQMIILQLFYDYLANPCELIFPMLLLATASWNIKEKVRSVSRVPVCVYEYPVRVYTSTVGERKSLQ